MNATETKPAPGLPTDLGTEPSAIRTRGLTKRYGRVQALDGVDLQVPEGAVYVLVGPNGAGKSTLLRALMDLVASDGGDMAVRGLDPRQAPGDVRSLIGYVPEDHRLGYPWMTIERLLAHHAVYRPTWDASYARQLAERYEVDTTRKCGTLSKGQARRVQILLALAHRPPLLLLDEPTDGLDHVAREAALGILTEHLADTPTTVLMSTHRVYEVEGLVDHVGVLNGGHLLAQLPREELRRKLKRYWADIPEGWTAPGEDGCKVVRRMGGAREIEWTVWGDEDRVRQSLARSGATVRQTTPLSVDEAALALLSKEVA